MFPISRWKRKRNFIPSFFPLRVVVVVLSILSNPPCHVDIAPFWTGQRREDLVSCLGFRDTRKKHDVFLAAVRFNEEQLSRMRSYVPRLMIFVIDIAFCTFAFGISALSDERRTHVGVFGTQVFVSLREERI